MCVYLFVFSHTSSVGEGEGISKYVSVFPVQQITRRISHLVKDLFRIGNQCDECWKQLLAYEVIWLSMAKEGGAGRY